MKMRLTRLEQETIINFNPAEDTASVYTADPVIYRRMIKRGYVPEVLDNVSWTFEVPHNHVVLPRKPRVLTEKQRLSLSERAKTLTASQKAKSTANLESAVKA